LETRIITQLNSGEDGGIPCFSQPLQRLLSLKTEESGSLESLTEIILSDYGLTSKVLQTVNSFYYSRFRREITTISQAVILLGFNRIKEIATGMAVINLAEGQESQEILLLISKAVAAAHFISNIQKQENKDYSERIFIATLLRQLPRLIIALTDSEIYISMKRFEEEGNLARARRILRTVGFHLQKRWGIPNSLAGHFEACSSLPGGPDREMRESIEIGYKLMDQVWNREDTEGLLGIIAEDTDLSRDAVKTALKRALKAATRAVPINCQLQQFPHHFSQEEKEKKREKSLDQYRKSDHEPLFMELLQHLMTATNDPDISIQQIFLMSIEIIRRILPVENAIICLVKKRGCRIEAKFGTGRSANSLKKILSRLTLNNNDALYKALNADDETLVSWSKILKANTPAILTAKSCVIIPVTIDQKPIACIFMDNLDTDEFDQAAMMKIRMVRQLIISAIRIRVAAGTKRGAGDRH